MGVGLRDRNARPITPRDTLDLSFLNWQRDQPYLFFERTRHRLDAISGTWPGSVRKAIEDLDLTYYIPCVAHGATVAYLGVSRTADGDFLSSVDLELLVTLSGYVAIAIENGRLYTSLARKADEYERLKEFSENIVESINVGILAAGLDDRVESWNTQIERLTGIPRDKAVGQPLASLFPEDLAEQFEMVRADTGIHHIYKYVLRPAARTMAVNGHANGNGNGILREATLHIAIAPLVSKNQEHIGRLIIFDDVTDRAELEKRLVQADKLSSIGLLAAGVAHEVNTPLAVISNYAQMLAKQVAEDDQKSRMLEKIAKSTFRASEIVNGLLNFSRTSSTEFGEVNLNRVIQETISLVEHQMKKAGVEVRTSLDATLGADPGQCRKAAASVSEPVSERARRHGGRRRAGDSDITRRRRRAGGCERHRTRHRTGVPASHLRSVLHHQERSQRHGAGTFGDATESFKNTPAVLKLSAGLAAGRVFTSNFPGRRPQPRLRRSAEEACECLRTVTGATSSRHRRKRQNPGNR